MKIDILTLFPHMLEGFLNESIIKRSINKNLVEINLINFRKYSKLNNSQVDDTPYGGGAGMVLRCEPIFECLDTIRTPDSTVILVTPDGQTYNQKMAQELKLKKHLIIICGHYEGFDARISNYLADEAISIGDFVLTGGELPAMMITDAVARMIPGVLGSEESAPTDSFYNGLLEHPQYTRPRDFEGMQVPEVLFSGNHAKINRWRREEALRVTFEKRPDLLKNAELDKKDKEFLAGLMDSD